MIEVHFYDYSGGILDVEKELKIDLVRVTFLTQKVSGIEYKMMDYDADINGNVIYYFSSNDEKAASLIS